ncbi:response regulator [Pseudooceanicola sp.]|uniref:response regulator n=1 Tax=Pseudooceanicola sp. TaxID=1914328 RepID=UPI0035C6CA17
MVQILIADDDAEYRAAFRNGLVLLGHEITEASTGQGALDHLARQPFDIVFLDVVMPGRGAVTLVHEISTIYPKLPIVVISGHADLYDTPLFREGLRKAKAVMRKTSSLAELNDTIRHIVS